MLTHLISIALAASASAATFQDSAKATLPDAAGVKAAFNASKGKVRIVMLVSPT